MKPTLIIKLIISSIIFMILNNPSLAEEYLDTDIIGDMQTLNFCGINSSRNIYLEYTASLNYPINESKNPYNSGDPWYDLWRYYRKLLNNGSEAFFYTGLSIPNHKQKIYSDKEDFVIDNNFAKTRAAKLMLDDYLGFKEIFPKKFCNNQKMKNHWLEELKTSPYYEKLKSKNFDEYPRLRLKIWIVPGSVSIENNDCKAYVKNKSLKVDIELIDAWLNLSDYSLDRSIKDDLQIRLKNWKLFVINELNTNKDEIESFLNNDPSFHETRSIFSSLILAQWYKDEKSMKLETFYLDSEGLFGIEQEFDRIPRSIDHTNEYCSFSGGTSFSSIKMDTSTINSSNQDIFFNYNRNNGKFMFKNKQYFQDGMWFDDPELAPIAIGMSSHNPVIGEEVNISVVVEGLWQERDASDFTIAFFDAFEDGNKTVVYRIGDVHVDLLKGGSMAMYNTTWLATNVGSHYIYAVVDYYNQISEINEQNNIQGSRIEVKSPYSEGKIIVPEENQVFEYNETITFASFYADDQSYWVSNTDGYLGKGEYLRKNLSTGTHIVSFIGKNRSNFTSIVQVPIHVLKNKNKVINISRLTPPNISKTNDSIVINSKKDNNNYQYMIDYGGWKNVQQNNINISDLNEGLHSVFVRQIDNNSYFGLASNISFFIDKTTPYPPILKEESFPTNRLTSKLQPFISWNDPGDIGSGIDHYEIRIDSGNLTSIGKNTSVQPKLTSGRHTIWIEAVDRVGLRSKESIEVYGDELPPDPPIVKIKSHKTEFSFYWEEPKDDSGIYGYYYIIDKNKDTIPNLFSGDWTNETSISLNPIEKDFYFHIVSIDNAGNIGEKATHFHYTDSFFQMIIERLIDSINNFKARFIMNN